jgi:hypothetical protein
MRRIGILVVLALTMWGGMAWGWDGWLGGTARDPNAVTSVVVNGTGGSVSGRVARVTMPIADTQARTRCTYLERNDLLTWVEMQIADSLTRVPLADGYRDFFEDQSGIDPLRSSNTMWSAGVYSWNAYTFNELVPNDSLFQYKMDDNDGGTAVVDSSGFTNAVCSRTTAASHTDGKIGGGFSFDGTSAGRVTVPGFKGTNAPFSVSFWVRAPPNALYNDVGTVIQFGSHDAGETYSYFCVSSHPTSAGALTYAFGASAPLNTTEAAVFDETWHNVVIAVSNTTESCAWVDGVPALFTESAPINFVASNDVAIGYSMFIDVLKGDFIGSLDDVRFYTSAVDQVEVDAIYAAAPEGAAGGSTKIVATNSAATLLDFTPSEGRLGLWVEETEPLTINTDAIGYLARDAAGTNWAAVTFAGKTAYSTNTGHYVWYSDVVALPGTGSNLLWKFESCNTNKGGRIRGVFPQVR